MESDDGSFWSLSQTRDFDTPAPAFTGGSRLANGCRLLRLRLSFLFATHRPSMVSLSHRGWAVPRSSFPTRPRPCCRPHAPPRIVDTRRWHPDHRSLTALALTVSIFVGCALPCIQDDRQALIALAILAWINVVHKVKRRRCEDATD